MASRLEQLQGELAQLRVRFEILETERTGRQDQVGPERARVPTRATGSDASADETRPRPTDRAAVPASLRAPPPLPPTPSALEPSPEVEPELPPVPEPATTGRAWSDWLPGWAQRLMGANTLVRTGVLVLFFGVAFLLKWVTERVTFPIEARLAAAALGGLALTGVGWHLRRRRPGYGLSLQGGGVGIFYIAIYAAAKIYHLLPPVVALAAMLGVVALAAVLAIAQNALPLALLGAAGGFLAPILTTTGEGDYRLLLGYYVLLNLGILALAFVKTWRPLNLLGFAFTFPFLAVGLSEFFRFEHFWGTAPFLWLLFAMYVGIAILYARHRSLGLVHYVDGTIVFGTPLAVGLLHQRLLDGAGDALAFAAVAFGVIYLALAWLVSRRRIVPSMRLLGEAFLAIGVVFLTLAIPLYFGARATSALWALEGAAIVWVSVRQRRLLGQAFGTLLQVLAGVSFIDGLLQDAGAWIVVDGVPSIRPLLNTDFLGVALLAVAGFFIARQFLRSHAPPVAAVGSHVAFWWALSWSVLGVVREVDRFVPSDFEVAALVGALAAGAATLMLAHRRLAWPVALQPVTALLPTMAVGLGVAGFTGHPLEAGGFLAWPFAFVVQYVFVATLDRERGALRAAAPVYHAGTYLLAVAFVQLEAWWLGTQTLELTPQTVAAVYLGLLAAALFALTLAQRGGTWPFRVHPRTYLVFTGGLLVVAIGFALVGTNLAHEGTAWRGIYLPVLNPVDLASVAALSVLWYWQLAVWRSGLELPYGRRETYLAFGAFVFFVINCMLLRALHHWAGTPYGDGMLRSTLVQTVLTVFWTVLSVAGMVIATRTGRRVLWLIGAGLLGVVVVKLFLFDLATLQGLQRIVAFLVVGLLLLAIGYFSPVPPRMVEKTEHA
jgi:uncharacterized membrane protein